MNTWIEEMRLMQIFINSQDAGGSMSPFVYVDDFPKYQGGDPPSVPSTGASECMRSHLTDSIDFLADFHSLSKMKVKYRLGC